MNAARPPADWTRRGAMIGATALCGLAALPGATAAAPVADTADPPCGRLCNTRVSRGARDLYAYLWSQYGTHTLTGQQEQNFTPAGPRQELDYLYRVTGKLPAILGLDYIDPRDQAAVNERAIAWHRSGGS